MEFRYTLQREEYMDFCKYEIYQSRDTQKLKYRCWVILPVVFIILLVALRPSHPIFYILAVLVSLLWIWLVNFLVARVVIKGAADKCDKVGEKAYRPIHMVIKDNSLTVNGTKCKLKNYRFFSSLILLLMEDNSMLILPARVFGADRDSLRQVVEELRGCM